MALYRDLKAERDKVKLQKQAEVSDYIEQKILEIENLVNNLYNIGQREGWNMEQEHATSAIKNVIEELKGHFKNFSH